jgi:glutamate-ammonia-ligase adenylyltransferase
MQRETSAFTIISPLPLASNDTESKYCLEALMETSALHGLTLQSNMTQLIQSAAGNAPFLSRIMLKYPDQLAQIAQVGFDKAWAEFISQLRATDVASLSTAELMAHLRHMKARMAMMTALADISHHWELMTVTRALSEFAMDVVNLALRHLLHKAAARGELNLTSRERPETNSGIIILGMGKLGAFELNYSSDIDLIVLFDPNILPYTGSRNAQHFMNKLASDLATILQERTADGYVFRTDLRLRPDPMSTPLAVTTLAALTYYETVGQNWERAAMIKARPIAGDMIAAASYMRELVPFIWRKTLDFATIADIHSIKRQMNVKAGKVIELPGHNIKIGMGGIREIEFFVQTQQLVWGGRIPEIRVPGTLAALDALVKFELVKPETRDTLNASYQWLRTIEHRLQMRQDEQTHSLPTDTNGLHALSMFAGYSSLEAFTSDCMATLEKVHSIYTESMLDSAPLAVDGNLVFTGVEADPETLLTLAGMGYTEAQRISDIIQGWHRGHRRSTRSKRSRQVLTELVPALLIALSKTANPDAAFFHFDDFIDRLPSGAQIFSLFLSRPEMLGLLADILGSAPALGDTLSNNPSLLDSVLEVDFFSRLPTKEELENLVVERLRFAHAFEQKMVYLRTFHNEKRFQAGVHLLKHIATPEQAGAFLSDIAEIILQCTMLEVTNEYILNAPGFTPVPFAVLALGKLGGREMTFGSDLDIVLLYDDGVDAASDTRTHLTRISQRFLSALTLLTREGRLYEVDTRLRPGGSDGPLAVSLAAFDAYFENSAWTYEHMALTRARVVATNHAEFVGRIEAVVKKHVCKPREAGLLLEDVVSMRERIAKQFPTRNPWALKHIRGGMVDLDFIAQYLVLLHAHTHPSIWHRAAHSVFEEAAHEGLLDASLATPLIAAKHYLSAVMSLLRLSAPGGVITDDAPVGLKNLLTHGMRSADFEALKEQMLHHEHAVSEAYATILGNPA